MYPHPWDSGEHFLARVDIIIYFLANNCQIYGNLKIFKIFQKTFSLRKSLMELGFDSGFFQGKVILKFFAWSNDVFFEKKRPKMSDYVIIFVQL